MGSDSTAGRSAVNAKEFVGALRIRFLVKTVPGKTGPNRISEAGMAGY
tara:strand:- start:29407 stop:29550 length:144 start_codon:yes stop_codon:yes gene_type:complete